MRPHVDPIPHVSPQAGCLCPACDANRLAHLRELSPAARRALAALDPRIPRHVDDIRRAGIRTVTVQKLMTGTRRHPALVQRLDLREALLTAPYYSFLLLTRHGADAVAARKRAGVPL